MKNKILIFLAFVLGIFFFTTPVKALTKINFEETENGLINTTLHFEEGFVGGIDITFRITGNVEVKDFQFSNKITSGNYKTEYQYDKTQKTLTVRVTTGGIGTSHNLLNEKKELVLGTINFTTSSKSNENYQLSETEFKIVDNNWASQTIAQSHITLGETTSFVYKVTEEVTPTPTPGTSADENNTGNTENSTNNGESSETEEQTTTTGSQENKTPNGVLEDPSKGNESEKEETKTPTEDEKTTETDEKEVAPSEERGPINWVIILGIVGLIAVGAGGYFVLFKKKKGQE